EQNEVRGGNVDLSAYSHLKRLKINSSHLRSSVKKLTLHNPELISLNIYNNTGLVSLDISECSQLKRLKFNNCDDNDLYSICCHTSTKVIGLEDTQLLAKDKHQRLKQLIEKYDDIKREEKDSSSSQELFGSSDEDYEVIENELINKA